MSYDAKPPVPYQVEKLARMAKANQAEVAAIQALRADGKFVDKRRVLKLRHAVKAQVRLERELARQAAKATAATASKGPGGLIGKIATEAREGGQ